MRGRPFLPLAGDPALLRLVALAGERGAAVHLVGGTVRDLLLGRPPADLDVAVGGDAPGLARAFAIDVGGSLVPLDDGPPTLRVVRPGVAGPSGLIDLAGYRAATLVEDLSLRDFTLNALAVPLAAVVAGETPDPIDPTGGLADLEARRLRMTAPRAFDDDPLRALRAYRLAAVLDLRLDAATARAAAARAPRLAAVSAERVAAESFRLLARGDARRHVAALGRAGLLGPALRLGGPPAPGWAAALARLAGLVADPAGAGGPAVAAALAATDLGGSLAAGRPRAALLRFALVAGRDAPDAARRLKLATREVAFLEVLAPAADALAAGEGAAADPAYLVRRFVRPLGDEAEAALVHAAVAPGRVPAIRRRALTALATLAAVVRPRLAGPRPLTGDDLVRECSLAPGPAVGRLLGWLDEARAAGLVTDRASALAFARGRLDQACRLPEHPV